MGQGGFDWRTNLHKVANHLTGGGCNKIFALSSLFVGFCIPLARLFVLHKSLAAVATLMMSYANDKKKKNAITKSHRQTPNFRS